jgi:hypothetical protein
MVLTRVVFFAFDTVFLQVFLLCWPSSSLLVRCGTVLLGWQYRVLIVLSHCWELRRDTSHMTYVSVRAAP